MTSDEAKAIWSERVEELADAVRASYGVEPSENGQKFAVPNILLVEQLLKENS